MRFRTGLLLTVLALPTALAQEVSVPCALAERLDLASFTLVGNYDGSEAGQDRAAADYAACQAAVLTGSLSAMPKLSARLRTLRSLYQKLNAADGALAYAMMGGGTMYSHGVPRSFPAVEPTLKSLAALAGSAVGGQTGARYTASLQDSRQLFARRVAALKTWKPDGSYPFDRAAYLTTLSGYEATGTAIMRTLGSRGDVATAAGYLPLSGSLFLDDILRGP